MKKVGHKRTITAIILKVQAGGDFSTNYKNRDEAMKNR